MEAEGAEVVQHGTRHVRVDDRDPTLAEPPGCTSVLTERNGILSQPACRMFTFRIRA